MNTVLFVALAAGLAPDPRTALALGLDAADPPPSLRAAFRASLTSAQGVRQIEYDPLKPADERFRILMQWGDDTELDQIVSDWANQPQPDVRLFADDLRESLGRGRIVKDGDNYRVDFRHKMSGNDRALDAAVSQNLAGRLTLDPVTGQFSRLEYRIVNPFRVDNGATVNQFVQSYVFGKSLTWGLTFVTGYDLSASGGRFGVSASREFSVRITDVAFTLAADSGQELESKSKAAGSSVMRLAGAGNP